MFIFVICFSLHYLPWISDWSVDQTSWVYCRSSLFLTQPLLTSCCLLPLTHSTPTRTSPHTSHTPPPSPQSSIAGQAFWLFVCVRFSVPHVQDRRVRTAGARAICWGVQVLHRISSPAAWCPDRAGGCVEPEPAGNCSSPGEDTLPSFSQRLLNPVASAGRMLLALNVFFLSKLGTLWKGLQILMQLGVFLLLWKPGCVNRILSNTDCTKLRGAL